MRYGLWIINCSTAVSSPPGSFRNCPLRFFEFYSLSHLIAGGGRARIAAGREVELVPGAAILVTPGERNRYGGDDGRPYVEDSIRFCADVPHAYRCTSACDAELSMLIYYGRAT